MNNHNILKTLLQNKFLNFLIKTLIAALLIWTIYQQVFAKENAADIWQTFLSHFHFPNLFWLIFTLFLVPFNWGLETLKWRVLIKHFSSISFWKTFKAILAGVTISLFTPNRIGEYGGRILMLQPENNWKGVVATLVGSLAQIIVVLILGLMGAIWFFSHFLEVETYLLQVLFFIGFAFCLVLLFCFFNIDLVIPIFKRLPFSERLKKYIRDIQVLKNYSTQILSKTLFYALIRVLIYSFQYYLILQFFGIEIPLLTSFAGILTIFLFQSSIPLPPILGLLARGEFALFIWGYFTENQINILAATYSLFLINLIIPAVLGLVFILQTNVLESLGFRPKK